MKNYILVNAIEIRYINSIYRESRIKWNEILEVFVFSNYQGTEDFLYWVIIGEKNKFLIPFSAKDVKRFVNEMQHRLPGFNNDALIEATTLVSGSLIIWKK